MAEYVDGFVVAVPKERVEDYRKMASAAAELWREHGATEVKECIADDVPDGKVTDFARSVKREDGETVAFSWITYESRADRDRVNAAVMDDPRMKQMMDDTGSVFDASRMIYGGFEVIVDA